MAEKLDDILKKMNKSFNSGSIGIGVEYTELDRIKFSSPKLNYMSYGGIPMKRAIEMAGAENSGKTTLSLDLCGNAQKQYPDRKVLFVDIECTFEKPWAIKLGVNPDTLIYYKPETQAAEEIFQNILNLLATGEISLCILDSLACMVPKGENDKAIEDATYAGISQALSKFCRKLTPILSRNDCSFIGINQLRDDLKSTWGGVKTPGGRMWKHTATVRYLVRKGSFIDEKGNELKKSAEDPAGNKIEVYLEKSKAFKSNRRLGTCSLNYDTGIDYISDIIDLAVKAGYIDMSGAWFKITDYGVDLKLQGKAKMHEHLANDKKLLDAIVADIDEHIIKE